MNILNTSPSELIDCISILFDCDTLEKINREISVAFNNPLKKFANDSEYNQFIKYLIDNYKDHMDFIKKDKKQNVLMRMWRKEKPCTLLT